MDGWRRFFDVRRARRAVALDLRLDEIRPHAAHMLDLSRLATTPVFVERAELLRRRRRFFVRMRSTDGVEGVTLTHERLADVWPLMVERVLPCFVGQDLRNLERLIEAVHRHDGNYKLVGVPFWSCVAAAEMAALDLLGKTAAQSVAELLGGAAGRDIPVYLSSMRRDTTPDEEVARLAPRLEATAALAVKLKIGGRMGVRDAAPGRTERLVALARRTFGDDVAVMVDANGSYSAEEAIEVGRMLEAHGVRYFEEPCAWEDFEATKRVADALECVQVAGGEQDGSVEKLAWMAANRGVDIVTPDVISNGGFLRTLRVLRLATAAGLDVALHSARSDFLACAMLQLASAAPDILRRPQEFLADEPRRESWYAPNFAVLGGMVAAPSGAGLGMTIDPSVRRRARVL